MSYRIQSLLELGHLVDTPDPPGFAEFAKVINRSPRATREFQAEDPNEFLFQLRRDRSTGKGNASEMGNSGPLHMGGELVVQRRSNVGSARRVGVYVPECEISIVGLYGMGITIDQRSQVFDRRPACSSIVSTKPVPLQLSPEATDLIAPINRFRSSVSETATASTRRAAREKVLISMNRIETH
jgi:hypothetical protein